MADGKVHANEEALIAFARTVLTQEYLTRLGKWVQSEYPGSADRVLPILRQIYKEKFK